MRHWLRSLGILLALHSSAILAIDTAPPNRLDVETLWRLHRVGPPAVSPDGRWVTFVATQYELGDNSTDAGLWLVPTDGSAAARRLTQVAGAVAAPFWSPDSRRIGFVAARNDAPAQLFAIDLDGGESQALATLPVAVKRAKWVAGGTRIVFEANTWPDLNERFSEVAKRIATNKDDKTQARISESRVLRYWDHYLTDGQVPHLFELEVVSGRIRDLLPGFDRITGFEGFEWDLASDGGELAYSANNTLPPHRDLNFDVFALDLAKGTTSNLTAENLGSDTRPVYARSGRQLLIGRTLRGDVGAEFTKLVWLDRERGGGREVAAGLDAPKASWQWSDDGREALFAAELNGHWALYRASVNGSTARRVLEGGTIDAIASAGADVVFLRSDFSRPAELQRAQLETGRSVPLTAFNAGAMSRLKLGAVRSVVLKASGTRDAGVQSWIVYPPDYRNDKRWPAIVLAHGGPFSAWDDGFSWRWNPHMFAAHGLIVVMPNFHGSTGFGQAYADSLLGAHGEKSSADILTVLDWLSARPDVDPKRIAIAGGSYGGYLAALMIGLTDRFKAAIVHAGVFDLSAQFASDSHWDRPSSYGNAPWTDPVELDRWSPSRLVPKMKTPTLILHGEKDYRVPVTQGINLYGALTGKGVPARIVLFPDENHWILKPQASRLWHQEVFAWLDRYLADGANAASATAQ